MKKKNTNGEEKKSRISKKRFFLNSAMYLALFGVAAATTYLIVPRPALGEDSSDDEGTGDIDDDPTISLTGKQKFISNLTNSATSGLNLAFTSFDAYFPGKDKDDSAKGNHIDASGTELTFSMEEVSAHGISLGLKGNVDYNGYKRQLDLLKVADDVYFSVVDLDNASYDFKYKASIEPKVSEDRDPTTGGLIQYEYGDVDWIVSDVLEILSAGGIQIDFPSIDLGGSSSSDSTVDSSNAATSEDGSSNTLTDILDSLNNMEEDAAHSYFTWNLPLGEETLPIGFKHDSEYNLSGVDFPAKTFDGSIENQQAYSIKNGEDEIGTIKASATVKTGTDSVDWFTFLPGQESQYHDIVDSASLFRKIARYAANPQFGLKTTNSLNVNSGNGLVLTHYESQGDSVTSSVLEQASLALSGTADFNDGLSSFGADVVFSADSSYAKLSGAYDGESAYMNVDDLLMAKVSKTNLDALFAKTEEALFSENGVEETAKETNDISDLISTVLDEFPTIKGFTEGHFEGAFDFIKSIEGKDNRFDVIFDLSPLKLDGEIVLSIDGTYSGDKEDATTDTYLSGIQFNGVKLSAFQLDGTLALDAYKPLSIHAEDYDELTHLPGIKDQIETVTSSKEAALSLSGHVYSGKKDDLGSDIGVAFSSDIGFSYGKKQAGIALTANQVSKKYSQDHHFAFSLDGDGNDFTNAALRYDSVNDASIDQESGLDETGKARTNPRSEKPLTGTMSISSMKDIVDTVKGMIPESEGEGEKSVFQKIAGAIGSLAGNDLADGLINHKFFGFAEKKILAEKASLSGDTNVFKLNGDLFGLSENPVVTIAYDQNTEEVNGGLKSLSFAMENTEISLGIAAVENVSESTLNPLKDEDLSTYTDFNTLKTLVEYGAGSFDLGKVASGDTSVYDVSMNLTLNIGQTPIDLLGVSLHLANEKDYLKAHLSIPYMPLIKGVNAPDDAIYFRDHEYEGRRSVDLYYSYKRGDEDYGDLYIARNSSYGRVTEVKDTVQLKGKDLLQKGQDTNATYSYDGIGWLLEYVLGVNESYLRKENAPETAPEESEAPVEEGTSLFEARFPHPEDFVKEYSFESDKLTWSMGVDVGSLLDERALLGDAMIYTTAKNVLSQDGSSSWKTLDSLKVRFSLALGNPDGTHQIVPASVEAAITLDNVATGVYQNTWSNVSINDFESIVSYDESGNPVFAYGDQYTKHYAKNGESPFNPGNYYVGVTC